MFAPIAGGGGGGGTSIIVQDSQSLVGAAGTYYKLP